jgi:hypothetical protein
MKHRRRLLSLGSSALLLFACARDHGQSGSTDASPEHTGDGSGGKAGESSGAAAGKAGAANPAKQEKAGGPGTKAVAALESVGDAATDAGPSLRGTATFNVTQSGVDLSIMARNCAASVRLQFFIQAGGDCSDETISGPRWQDGRGDGIPDVACLGVSGQGRAALTRSSDEARPWTIGGSSDTNVLGHAFVAYDAESGAAVACGVIMLEQGATDAPASDPGASRNVPLLGRAQIAGACLGQMIVRDNEQACPDPKALSACAEEHCQLDACVATCADYLACTTQAEDPCSVAFTCEIDSACSKCQGSVQTCSFNFCADQLTCAAPVTPDGPCSQLEACCGLQGDKTESCLELVRQLEQISGDPSCFGVMRDWDFVAHLPVPCMFE